MPEQDEKEELGSLAEKSRALYAGSKRFMDVRAPLTPPGEHGVPHLWESGKRKIEALMPPKHKHLELATIFFIAAIGFFVIAAAVAAYLFISGGNAVSTDNIAVTIQGPTTIAGGDTVPLSLTIVNGNPVALDDAELEIDFPEGTRSSENVLQNYPRYTESLGSIPAGGKVTRSVKAIIFGGEGQALTLPVSLSYGTAGSSAIFVKRASYGLTVSSAPLSVSIQAPSEVVSGRPFAIDLVVRSNATTPVGNVVLSGQYPFGFSVVSTSVPAQGALIPLGTMKPGEARSIEIVGTLSGASSDSRVFHFSIGTAGPSGTLAVAYMTQEAEVLLTAPFLATTLALNGSSAATPVITPGNPTTATVSWANTLSTEVDNAEISVTISGPGVDYGSIQTASGFYRSADHTVVFNSSTDHRLATLAPGETGSGTFSFKLVSGTALSTLRNPTVTFSLSIAGQRVGQSNVPEQVSASASTIAKIASVVGLSAISLHATGPFANTGPIPPRADTATSYTIIWKIDNSTSDIAGASVSAVLPAYVSYAGVSSPSTGLSYDATTRALSWSAGDVPTGASKQIAFQITLTPSTSQKGSAPVLVPAATLTAFDRFAQAQISGQAPAATTETVSEPGYTSANAAVQ